MKTDLREDLDAIDVPFLLVLADGGLQGAWLVHGANLQIRNGSNVSAAASEPHPRTAAGRARFGNVACGEFADGESRIAL